MSTSTVENYVKQLYLEERGQPGEMIGMGRLATVMGVVPGTATAMVKAVLTASVRRNVQRTQVQSWRAAAADSAGHWAKNTMLATT